MDEHAAVIDEVVGIAASENPDLVLHSGDLFDRPVPTVEALSVGLGVWSGSPIRVVGRWWSSPGITTRPNCSRRLKPFLSPFGVHLVGKIMSADEGGVITLSTGAGTAHVACLPFLRASQVVDFMSMTDDWYRTCGSTSENRRDVCRRPGKIGEDRRCHIPRRPLHDQWRQG